MKSVPRKLCRYFLSLRRDIPNYSNVAYFLGEKSLLFPLLKLMKRSEIRPEFFLLKIFCCNVWNLFVTFKHAKQSLVFIHQIPIWNLLSFNFLSNLKVGSPWIDLDSLYSVYLLKVFLKPTRIWGKRIASSFRPHLYIKLMFGKHVLKFAMTW